MKSESNKKLSINNLLFEYEYSTRVIHEKEQQLIEAQDEALKFRNQLIKALDEIKAFGVFREGVHLYNIMHYFLRITYRDGVVFDVEIPSAIDIVLPVKSESENPKTSKS